MLTDLHVMSHVLDKVNSHNADNVLLHGSTLATQQYACNPFHDEHPSEHQHATKLNAFELSVKSELSCLPLPPKVATTDSPTCANFMIDPCLNIQLDKDHDVPPLLWLVTKQAVQKHARYRCHMYLYRCRLGKYESLIH